MRGYPTSGGLAGPQRCDGRREVLTIAHVGTADAPVVGRAVRTNHRRPLFGSENGEHREPVADRGKDHPYRNVIYRSIGADEAVEIDLVAARSQGHVLLCAATDSTEC